MRRAFIIGLLSLCALVGFFPVESTGRTAEQSIPTLTFVRRKGEELVIRLQNPTTRPISYSGYSSNDPIYRLSRKTLKGWTYGSLGWCGTGLGTQSLSPGRSVFFKIKSPGSRDEIFRVGMNVSFFPTGSSDKRTDTIWTAPIKPSSE
jgi:hypothetical protein